MDFCIFLFFETSLANCIYFFLTDQEIDFAHRLLFELSILIICAHLNLIVYVLDLNDSYSYNSSIKVNFTRYRLS